jgi:peptidase S46-like protein
MRRWSALVVLVAAVFAPSAAPLADEGMWTFDNPPLKQWKERYGFEPTSAWLDHVRLASVRLNDGGSGAFVSPNGLLMTNQHVAGGQLHKVSTRERDYIKNGFYAATREAEIKCPDLEVNVLVSYENVTERIQSVVQDGATATEAVDQRRVATAAIERESTAQTGLRSDVVALYNGGEYWLYRFKKYTDLRIVFSPEEQIGFFGGNYDNFTYPRYDLDVAFFRVYENNQPVHTDYFKWSDHGADEGELVFISGNPGSTARLLTLTQIQFQRDYSNPVQMLAWTTRRDALVEYAKRSPEAARSATELRRSLDNSMKRLAGQQNGLLHQGIIEKKQLEERSLRAAVTANPQMQRAYGSAWDEIASAYLQYPTYVNALMFSTLGVSRLGGLASTFVRYAEEIQKPDAQRYREFRDSNLESLKFQLLSPAPIDTPLEEALLTAWFFEAQKILGNEDPFVSGALGGLRPADAARTAVGRSELVSPAVRKRLLDGGPDAILKSDDSLLALARRVEPAIRNLRAWQERTILSVEASAGDKIARARFAVYGRSTYPDATFTPRIGYGIATGYESLTTKVPFKTTFYGLYERAETLNYKSPFDLPERYLLRQAKLNLATPLNFVYTADSIGGNSGSPVINRNAEIVGLHFDSNIQKLANRYAYVDDSEGSRGVAVHSSAIIEALAKLYDAQPLADEILARTRPR